MDALRKDYPTATGEDNATTTHLNSIRSPIRYMTLDLVFSVQMYTSSGSRYLGNRPLCSIILIFNGSCANNMTAQSACKEISRGGDEYYTLDWLT